jgi:DNA-binding MarR family transcriptional regulator
MLNWLESRRMLDNPCLIYVYTSVVRQRTPTIRPESERKLFPLPCACQNLRRATRIVTRIYDEELREAGLEITQFGLLTALAEVGEANQKRLSAGFAMDSTTLTRTLRLLQEKGWIHVRRGDDRRERLFTLTEKGKQKMAAAQPNWERAEQRLREKLGSSGWKAMREIVSRVTKAGMIA